MPKPAARKNSAPPPRAKKARTTTSKPRRGGACSACGAKADAPHQEACPNGRCADCSLMAGNHETDCPQHPQNAVALDGKTGGPIEIETDVDGKKAKVKVTKRAAAAAEKKPQITRLFPPALKNAGAAIKAVQRAIDDKHIFGIKQALTKTEQCSYEWFDEKSQQVVGCFSSAVFDFEETSTCPTCNKTAKKVDEPLCLTHMCMKQMDELPAQQVDMFESDAERAL